MAGRRLCAFAVAAASVWKRRGQAQRQRVESPRLRLLVREAYSAISAGILAAYIPRLNAVWSQHVSGYQDSGMSEQKVSDSEPSYRGLSSFTHKPCCGKNPKTMRKNTRFKKKKMRKNRQYEHSFRRRLLQFFTTQGGEITCGKSKRNIETMDFHGLRFSTRRAPRRQ